MSDERPAPAATDPAAAELPAVKVAAAADSAEPVTTAAAAAPENFDPDGNDHGPPRAPAGLHVSALVMTGYARGLLDFEPDELAALITIAAALKFAGLKSDRVTSITASLAKLSNYQPDQLALYLDNAATRIQEAHETFAARHTAPRKLSRRRLTTGTIVKRLQLVADQLADGTVAAPAARAQIYALQTLLSANKLAATQAPDAGDGASDRDGAGGERVGHQLRKKP